MIAETMESRQVKETTNKLIVEEEEQLWKTKRQNYLTDFYYNFDICFFFGLKAGL